MTKSQCRVDHKSFQKGGQMQICPSQEITFCRLWVLTQWRNVMPGRRREGSSNITTASRGGTTFWR
eukprot:8044258-Karenia_brevis.AAC.1